ncbi:MAG: hypothetical protein GXZ11_08290 [Tissierellia bacterium]|nr:hypothetical protein [Tissierellia bacterium]
MGNLQGAGGIIGCTFGVKRRISTVYYLYYRNCEKSEDFIVFNKLSKFANIKMIIVFPNEKASMCINEHEKVGISGVNSGQLLIISDDNIQSLIDSDTEFTDNIISLIEKSRYVMIVGEGIKSLANLDILNNKTINCKKDKLTEMQKLFPKVDFRSDGNYCFVDKFCTTHDNANSKNAALILIEKYFGEDVVKNLK